MGRSVNPGAHHSDDGWVASPRAPPCLGQANIQKRPRISPARRLLPKARAQAQAQAQILPAFVPPPLRCQRPRRLTRLHVCVVMPERYQQSDGIAASWWCFVPRMVELALDRSEPEASCESSVLCAFASEVKASRRLKDFRDSYSCPIARPRTSTQSRVKSIE